MRCWLAALVLVALVAAARAGDRKDAPVDSLRVDLGPVPDFTLTSEEHDAFRALASDLADYDPVTETEQYVLAAQIAAGRLPERVRRTAARFNREGAPAGG